MQTILHFNTWQEVRDNARVGDFLVHNIYEGPDFQHRLVLVTKKTYSCGKSVVMWCDLSESYFNLLRKGSKRKLPDWF